jgi:hypothetical protein
MAYEAIRFDAGSSGSGAAPFAAPDSWGAAAQRAAEGLAARGFCVIEPGPSVVALLCHAGASTAAWLRAAGPDQLEPMGRQQPAPACTYLTTLPPNSGTYASADLEQKMTRVPVDGLAPHVRALSGAVRGGFGGQQRFLEVACCQPRDGNRTLQDTHANTTPTTQPQPHPHPINPRP